MTTNPVADVIAGFGRVAETLKADRLAQPQPDAGSAEYIAAVDEAMIRLSFKGQEWMNRCKKAEARNAELVALLTRAWQLLDAECTNDALTDELFAALREQSNRSE